MYPQSMFEQKYENCQNISTKLNCHFLAVKNRCILHARVFVMFADDIITAATINF